MLRNLVVTQYEQIPRTAYCSTVRKNTPRTMDIFILTELRNGSSVREPCHTGSTPSGYGPPICRQVVCQNQASLYAPQSAGMPLGVGMQCCCCANHAHDQTNSTSHGHARA